MSLPATDAVASAPSGDTPRHAPIGLATTALTSPRTADEIVAAMRSLAQKGKAPGFEARPGGFRLRAFGDPFDHWLDARISPAGGRSGGGAAGSSIDLSLKMAAKLPVIFLVISVLTIQPGMWLTDSMLKTYSTWYAAHVQTWWWYMPLVVLPLPYMFWRMWKKSRAAAADHASELLERVAAAAGANDRSA